MCQIDRGRSQFFAIAILKFFASSKQIEFKIVRISKKLKQFVGQMISFTFEL